MIRYGLLIVTFFLALSVSADNKNAVVRIYNYKSTNSVSCGTGFFVRLNNRTYIATAYHVIANSQKIEVYSFSGKLSNVTCVGHYILGDLALLSFDKPPSSITWLDIAKPPDNLLKTEAIAIGHPNSIKYQEFKIMFPNDKLMHCKEMFDNDSKPVFKFGVNLEIIPIYGGIYNGMSGAPLIVNGKVIGVLSGSLSQGGTYAWAIPTSNFLNIKFLPSPISDFRTFADYPYLNNTHRPLTRSATVIQQDEEDDLYNEGVLNYETTFLKIEENAKLVNYYNDQRTKIF
ncbi:MAG: serine protease, partial [Chitinophagaceae bacterium]